ncbi:hypothetical protein [Acetobacter thailandicus]|uniref:hypothetical protein n=1 Tax=Acetobacter thailandicus TaxID=1502842 RepID=UPI001BADD903|nr:hypothetical protein [Acetobacter thailandicus]MBS1003205.1 hypothetical protein [Acetobacter thailandicus]
MNIILYFYIYCIVGIICLFIEHLLLTEKQSEEKHKEMEEAIEDAHKTFPIPAVAAAYVLTAATTILMWPYFIVKSLLRGSAP